MKLNKLNRVKKEKGEEDLNILGVCSRFGSLAGDALFVGKGDFSVPAALWMVLGGQHACPSHGLLCFR